VGVGLNPVPRRVVKKQKSHRPAKTLWLSTMSDLTPAGAMVCFLVI